MWIQSLVTWGDDWSALKQKARPARRESENELELTFLFAKQIEARDRQNASIRSKDGAEIWTNSTGDRILVSDTWIGQYVLVRDNGQDVIRIQSPE